MSIENMTYMSYVMFGVAGVSAVAAAVLFFVLDIAKCWRMVSGKCGVSAKKQRRAERAAAVQGRAAEKTCPARTEKISGLEITVPLGSVWAEETTALDTVSLEMIQDIVYMQDTVEIGEILPKNNFSEKKIN